MITLCMTDALNILSFMWENYNSKVMCHKNYSRTSHQNKVQTGNTCVYALLS